MLASQPKLAVEEIRRQVAQLILLHPQLAEDEVLRADSIEGETNLFELMDVLIDKMQDADAMVEAIQRRAEKITNRQERYLNRKLAMRDLIFTLMQAADVTKIERPEATLSIRKLAAKVVITDEESLPPYYLRNNPTPDKTKIKEALQLGEEIPGACLSNGSVSLSVRVK
ncbi:MAG: siphovirus Gp157 family protein [Acidobacteria bacterium]|nr:siphovirus Gp157 family protein [Acidobacteriota bacterium]